MCLQDNAYCRLPSQKPSMVGVGSSRKLRLAFEAAATLSTASSSLSRMLRTLPISSALQCLRMEAVGLFLVDASLPGVGVRPLSGFMTDSFEVKLDDVKLPAHSSAGRR